MANTTPIITLGELADKQAERNPRTEGARGRVAGGGKPTSKPLVANGRPLRRYELSNPVQASEEVLANYAPCSVITLGAISDMTIDIRKDALDERMLSSDMDSDCLTQIGDIVLSLTSPFSSACIDEQATGLFIPNTCAVIRMDDETRKVLNPWFLVGYLNLDVVRRDMFEKRTTSGSWQSLRIEDLRSVEISLPEIEIQDALGEVLKSHVDSIRTARNLQEMRNQLIDDAYGAAISKIGKEA